ncbi:MAG: zeta toxin family protein [Proteobacteria bacterium]|nr:zeta toxin family protein [Pseudomonadota bacterium]
MIVTGQPGAGLASVAVDLSKQLLRTVDTAAHVSVNRLRAYHPLWAQGGDLPPTAAARVAESCQAWFERIVADAQRRRLNLVAEVETIAIDTLPTLATDLRSKGYVVQAVFVAASREESCLAMLAHYEMRRRSGLAAEAPSIKVHDHAFNRVSNVLGRMELEHLVEGLRVVAPAGSHLYESRVIGGELRRVPRAAEILGIQQNKPPSAKELVQYAMRWETLVQRMANDPRFPREIASQTVQGRNAAVARCERDATADQMLKWAREAGAFRVMNRFEFLNEFPHHARAVQAMNIAAAESEKYPTEQAERLMLRARENIAQRIERGDMARIAARREVQVAQQGRTS